MDRLIEGYRRFRTTTWPAARSRYEELAKAGQSPETLVIACSDSRVDPQAVFGAGPGELFVVRNIANLVPPFEPHGNFHGTSAALEFAVTTLNVEHIVVLGHARCGGIAAFLDGLHRHGGAQGFIARWLEILNGARVEDLAARQSETDAVAPQQAMEHAGIHLSLENLTDFPFVKERLAEGRLSLHGAYFDIANGALLSLDPESGAFEPVT